MSQRNGDRDDSDSGGNNDDDSCSKRYTRSVIRFVNCT